MALASQCAQRFGGDFADAPRRRIQHAQQGDVVVSKHRQPHVSEDVLDFGSLIKADPAEQAVTDALGAKGFFERPRLRVGAIHHGAMRSGIVALDFDHALADVLRFGARVAGFKENEIGTLAPRRGKFFSDAFDVFRHHSRGGIQNLLARTVILFDAEDLRVGEILGKAQDVADVGAAPAIDGLVLSPKIAEGQLQRSQLLFLVEDRKIAWQTQPRRLAAKKSDAKGMKSADPRIAGARIGAFEQHPNAFAHLTGGLIRKGDRENRAAPNTLLDEISDAMGDHARLAGAGASQNEDRPIGGEHSFALLRIQVIENIHLSESPAGSALGQMHFSRAQRSEQTGEPILPQQGGSQQSTHLNGRREPDRSRKKIEAWYRS